MSLLSIFIYKVKYFLQSLLALAVVFVVFCFLWCMHIPRFSSTMGEDRVFYLQSASSQGLRTEVLQIKDLPNIRGEIVRFYVSRQTGTGASASGEAENLTEESAQAIAEEIAKTYGAEILFTEKIGEILSFYAHTLRFADGVAIYGAKINLHIAINLENSTGAVGSPIIFDGY
jgi:kynurenine formamidase